MKDEAWLCRRRGADEGRNLVTLQTRSGRRTKKLGYAVEVERMKDEAWLCCKNSAYEGRSLVMLQTRSGRRTKKLGYAAEVERMKDETWLCCRNAADERRRSLVIPQTRSGRRTRKPGYAAEVERVRHCMRNNFKKTKKHTHMGLAKSHSLKCSLHKWARCGAARKSARLNCINLIHFRLTAGRLRGSSCIVIPGVVCELLQFAATQ